MNVKRAGDAKGPTVLFSTLVVCCVEAADEAAARQCKVTHQGYSISRAEDC